MSDINEQINSEAVIPSHYAQIPNIAVIDLKPNEYILYGAYLRTIWNSENGSCWKSQKTLAEEIGYSVPTLRKAKTELVKKGYIKVKSGVDEGKTDVITLLNKWEENRQRKGGVQTIFAGGCKQSFYK